MLSAISKHLGITTVPAIMHIGNSQYHLISQYHLSSWKKTFLWNLAPLGAERMPSPDVSRELKWYLICNC